MYIFAQIFGAFIAGLVLMGQYHEQIAAYTAASLAKTGSTVVSNSNGHVKSKGQSN